MTIDTIETVETQQANDSMVGRVPDAIEEPITGDELDEMALAADPDAALEPDAVPLYDVGHQSGLLPLWYMPTPQGAPPRRASLLVTMVVILSLLTIVASGLCITYGVLEVA